MSIRITVESTVQSLPVNLKDKIKALINRSHNRSSEFEYVNIVSNLSPEYSGEDIRSFIMTAGYLSKFFKAGTPTIVSMKRDSSSQAREMIRTFKDDRKQFKLNYLKQDEHIPSGSSKTGKLVFDYLSSINEANLSRRQFFKKAAAAAAVAGIAYTGIGSNEDEVFNNVVDILDKNPPLSYHMSGRAIDFRVTNGIENVLRTTADALDLNVHIYDETRSSSPHWHVSFS